ncbi:MAG: CBS domain-containing protein, partial [Sedimentisphaerales bacterium]|nr:CBS domain-containing protein [Sedimentisphaerales bacterium]
LVRLALETRRNVIFTLDEDNQFTGAISLQDLKYVLSHPRELMNVHHIMDFKEDLSPVLVTQSLDAVVDRFAETGFDRLPVVDAQNRLVGSVLMSDIMRQYNHEVANRNITIELGARITAHDQPQTLHIGADTVVTEIEAPRWMTGKKLSDLMLRTRYHVSVFIVKERHEPDEPRFITPDAAYIFREGDTLLVSGAEKDIEAMKNNA